MNHNSCHLCLRLTGFVIRILNGIIKERAKRRIMGHLKRFRAFTDFGKNLLC